MYKDEIAKYSPLTIEDIVRTCQKLVSSEYRNIPWAHPELKRGVGILQSEDGLNSYMASYGESHTANVFKAIKSLPAASFTQPFELFDWGCGQGIGTVCLIQYLRETNQIANLKQITLIEPSSAALARAEVNIRACIHDIKIVKINKGLPPTQPLSFDCVEKIDVKYPTALHLFSNILDIDTIDLKSMAKVIAAKGHKHIVSCIGPANRREDRINSFCRYFDEKATTFFQPFRETEFFRCKTYRPPHTFGCFIRNFTFSLDSGEPILIPYKFFAPKQFYAAYKSDILDEIPNFDLCDEDCAFDILAPFDIGASVYNDVHPILAVLNNIVVRGLPTKASPFIEQKLADLYPALHLDDESIQYGSIKYTGETGCNVPIGGEAADLIKYVPLAVARIEKTIIEAILTGHISINDDKWHVLVKECDVPCAALAFEDIAQMFNHLAAATRDFDNLRFPEVDLTIINPKYQDSSLHLGHDVYSKSNNVLCEKEYDMAIDFSINEKSKPFDVEFSEFKAKNKCYFNVRSTSYVYADRTIYTSDRIVYKPLTRLNTMGTHDNIEEAVEHLRYFIQLLFRKQNFREGQLPIISRALQLKSVIGLLPTGGGKSLTYQISAMLQPGVTIVVDPLMSLMKDQYDGLIKNGIDYCTYINSTVQDKARRENLMKESKLLFVFLSPERLSIYRFRDSLRAMADNHVYFAYGIIDEVHCVSEWGHDFRFSYLHLGRNMYNYVLPKQTNDASLNHITLVGLTATASFDVLADVERELSGNNAFPLDLEATVRYENTNRLELQYRIIRVDDEQAHDKWDVYQTKNEKVPQIVSSVFHDSISELLRPENIQRIKERFISRENIEPDSDTAKKILEHDLNVEVNRQWYANPSDESSAIIFCPHRTGTLGVHNGKRLGVAGQIRQTLGIHDVSEFVGGDDPKAQDEFIKGRTNIMVATKAFGMGIDKPHVRFTLNMNHSGSLEAFVQEAGRAGRDKHMALAIILYSDKVFNEQDEFTRLLAPVAVDYGVHKFFYDGNFLGENTEWTVMDYLMNYQSVLTEDVDKETRINKSVSGFLKKLNAAKDGEAVVSYISCEYPSRDSETLDGFLRQRQLRPITTKPRHPGELESSLRSVNQEQYQASLMKAIYRMCCIGLIEDFTQSYIPKPDGTTYCEYRIVTRKKPAGSYYAGLKDFFLRYYNEEKANAQIAYCKKYSGTEIANCLFFLTQFIYRKIATKRKRAILDIEQFCKEATEEGSDWLAMNEELKDTLYYYFNSKYARSGYQDESGKPFSLLDDTESGKNAYFTDTTVDPYKGSEFANSIVAKYMSVINSDGMSSPKDNIKHLQGAVRLIRRGILSVNPALSLLNVYCLLFLKADESSPSLNEEFETSFSEGYSNFSKIIPKEKLSQFFENYFEELLRLNVTNYDHIERMRYLILMEEVKQHVQWTSNFRKTFTEK